MTEIQIISKVLTDKKMDLITNNNLTEEYFINYQNEYTYILNHYAEYGNVPDIETFLDKFPNFEVLNVRESTEYLLNTIREEYQYTKIVPVINKLADILQTDSYAAVRYLQSVMPQLESDMNKKIGKDIVKESQSRYDEYVRKLNGEQESFIPTGFDELDELIGGLSKGEEFVLILARTGEGKTWVLLKMLEFAWKSKFKVGLIEPEMTADKVGYRFDTLNANISNTSMLRGKDNIEYKKYIDRLKKSRVPFIVATPKDFGGSVTISKLRTFCKSNDIQVLGIDGISYLKDERSNRGDNKTTALTNISEDLMSLSIELGIPIICVVQSNRGGVGTPNGPDIENIRDSDGIAYNASLIISIKQKEPGIELSVKKNRNGDNNVKLTYAWNIDIGTFMYVPTETDSIDNSEAIENQRRRYRDKGEAI